MIVPVISRLNEKSLGRWNSGGKLRCFTLEEEEEEKRDTTTRRRILLKHIQLGLMGEIKFSD